MLLINKDDTSDTAELNSRKSGKGVVWSLSMHHRGFGHNRRRVEDTDFEGTFLTCLHRAERLGLSIEKK